MFGHDRVTSKAKILSDEGYKMARNDAHVALQHEKYIVEVHPDVGEPFRTETTVWVDWWNCPKVGDLVQVTHKAGSQNVDIVIEGDPRYDWKMIAAKQGSADTSNRKNLLDGPANEKF